MEGVGLQKLMGASVDTTMPHLLNILQHPKFQGIRYLGLCRFFSIHRIWGVPMVKITLCRGEPSCLSVGSGTQG